MSTDTYCRLCAEMKPSAKQLDLTADTPEIRSTMTKLRRLDVEGLTDLDNGLPKNVCLICFEQLEKTSYFIQSIERAQRVLKDVCRSVKEEYTEDSYGEAEPISQSDEDEKKPLQLLKLEESNTDLDLFKEIPKKKKKYIVIHSEETWKNYPWKCAMCNVNFVTVEEMRKHSKTHNVCAALKCTDCDKKVSSFAKFITHVRGHRKHLKYLCIICNEKFESSSLTKLHETEHDRTNECFACGEIQNGENALKEHTDTYAKKRRKWKKETPVLDDLQCNSCNKEFKSRANLLVHMQIHTERKREHTCEKCGKTFFNKGTLGSHMILHEDARPFKCEICGASFKTSTQLRSHVGIHGGPRPYSCDQCGRNFRLRCHLKSHLIIHTDSMPHTCEYCGKAFRFKTILTQHLRQHTGVKPYVCQMCHRDFTNWPNYNKHMKRRHHVDMAKKKHTPEGVYPVNPLTGEVLITQTTSASEWKDKIMNDHRKPGRPRLEKKNGVSKSEIEIARPDGND